MIFVPEYAQSRTKVAKHQHRQATPDVASSIQQIPASADACPGIADGLRATTGSCHRNPSNRFWRNGFHSGDEVATDMAGDKGRPHLWSPRFHTTSGRQPGCVPPPSPACLHRESSRLSPRPNRNQTTHDAGTDACQGERHERLYQSPGSATPRGWQLFRTRQETCPL